MAIRRRRIVVAGIDMSLRGCGMAAIASNWKCEFARVKTERFGVKLHNDATEMERAERIDALVSRAMLFLRRHNVTHAWFEQYAWGSHGAHVRSIAEVCGALKLAILLQGIELDAVGASQARKLLLGKAPGKGAKDITQAALAEMGATFPSHDEGDAFVVANFGLTELGIPALVQKPPPKPPKRSRVT